MPDAALRSPMTDSTSSSWPLPATPAMPRISPARISRSTPRTTSLPRSSWTWSLLIVEDRRGRMRLAPVDRELDAATDHELGEVLLGRLAGRRARR